jgi:hypothetical protein
MDHHLVINFNTSKHKIIVLKVILNAKKYQILVLKAMIINIKNHNIFTKKKKHKMIKILYLINYVLTIKIFLTLKKILKCIKRN